MLDYVPDAWGPKFKMNGGAVAYTQTGPNSIRFQAPDNIALVMFAKQPQRRVSLNSDRIRTADIGVGTLEIVPFQSDLFASWPVEKQNLLIALDPARLRRLAGIEFDHDTPELYPPGMGFVDGTALTIASQICQEMTRPDCASAELLDALITVFTVHLLRTHSSLSAARQIVTKGGLPPMVWKRVDEFIHEGLSGQLTLEQLAQIAGLSPSHFIRAFRQTTGQTPYRYIISCRLIRAQEMIRENRATIGEIARSVGFSSNSHMTAMMKRNWNTTPTQLRLSGG